MDCLTPPLECVPLDEWFCPDCELSRDDGMIGNGAILERVFDALEGAMSDIIGMYLFLGIRCSVKPHFKDLPSFPPPPTSRKLMDI